MDIATNGALFALWSPDWDRDPPPYRFMAGSFPEADADKVVIADIIHSGSRQNVLTLADIAVPKSTSGHLAQLLQNPLVQPLFEAIEALQRRDYDGADEAVRPSLDHFADQIAKLEQRPAIKKIFLSGFGWSGSSAVHDALTGYPGVFEMPGTGEIAHMNAGADNEPVYLQGASGLGSLWAELKSQSGLSAPTLWSFFRLYVLAAEPYTYEDYKAAHASRALQMRLGDLYFVLLMDLIAHIAKEGAEASRGPDGPRFSVTPFQRYSNLLVASLAKDGDRFALFNNAIFVHAAGQIELVTDAVMIAVGRDVRDQFADQRRNNLYFSHRPASFVSRNQRQRRSLQAVFQGFKASRNDLSYQYVQFERFVLDTVYRAGIVRALIGTYDASSEAVHFNPVTSSRNIGGHADVLCSAELAVFNASDLAYDAIRSVGRFQEFAKASRTISRSQRNSAGAKRSSRGVLAHICLWPSDTAE